MTDTSTAPPEVSPAQLVFQVASGFMASAALQVAMRLDIAERLTNGPRAVADLARDTGVQPDGLYRVLRALASLGIFDETSPRTFALTPSAELLRKGPGRLGDGIEFITDPLHFQMYAEAMYSVQTGKPAVADGTPDPPGHPRRAPRAHRHARAAGPALARSLRPLLRVLRPRHGDLRLPHRHDDLRARLAQLEHLDAAAVPVRSRGDELHAC